MAHDVTKRIHRIQDDVERVDVNETFVEDGKRYAVVRRGTEFRACVLDPRASDAQSHDGELEWWLYVPTEGYVYGPVHPDTTYDDVNGATYAHDTGENWTFHHCSPAEQIDLATRIQTFAVGCFQLLIERAQVKVFQTENRAAKRVAITKTEALIALADAVGSEAHKTVVGQTLGYYHRSPHEDHYRKVTAAAITAVLADWKTKALTDATIRKHRLAVTQDAARVVTSLQSAHTIQTWQAKRKADAAAAAAKKAKETT